LLPGARFQWASSDARVAPITGSGAATVTITGHAMGASTITATPTSGVGASTTLVVDRGTYLVYDNFESRRDYRRAVNVSRAAEIVVRHKRSG